jgi:hypothetical protein
LIWRNASTTAARNGVTKMEDIPMARTRGTIFLVGVFLAVGIISTSTIAQSKKATATRDAQARQLLRAMDKDKDGTVSKQEYLDFMSGTYNRLDVKKNGQLKEEELRRLTSPDWPGIFLPSDIPQD